MTPLFLRLWQHAKDRPDCVAFQNGDQSLTWHALAARVAGAATALQHAPDTIGLALPNGPDYVVADLAATLAGKCLVPIPHFFGAGQIEHIIKDAGIKAMIGGAETTVPRLDHILTTTGTPMAPIPGHRRVIYTSGSSGQPKGVIIGATQITASLNALLSAVGTSQSDVYLSVLPAAQLLEQICGIFLPVMAGARTVFSPSAMAALFAPAPGVLAHAFAKHRPTMSLLAPQLLAAWLGDIDQGGTPPPETLRFVALGGAPASPAMLHKALDAGIPIYEGYGLSEACSVVAMNRIDDNEPGTVGRVLDGLSVEIDAGEIVVSGPTVMHGYLHHPAVSGRWHTGDLGHFDDGRLVIEGRKDNLIVTPAGRNISPEWVESMVDASPAIACSALVARSDGLTLVIARAAKLGVEQIMPLLDGLPDYARPDRMVLVDPRKSGLIRPAGTPDRLVAQRLADVGPAFTIPSQKESAA